MVSACYNAVGEFPLLCLHDENLSWVIITKQNHLYFTGNLFIYVGFFYSEYPLFTFTCQSFGKLFAYKNYRWWFILFFCQIWYRIWVWAAVHKLKKHERCIYRTCWKKISCSAPDANIIFECSLTDMFHCIYFPLKKDSKKNVTPGQSVQRNIVTQQKHHTPYRRSVMAGQRPNTQTLCSLWGLLPPRSLTSTFALQLQWCPCGCSAVQKEILRCTSQTLLRYNANPEREKWTLTK